MDRAGLAVKLNQPSRWPLGCKHKNPWVNRFPLVRAVVSSSLKKKKKKKKEES